jgi:Tfp pilus assembly major pilin PilA
MQIAKKLGIAGAAVVAIAIIALAAALAFKSHKKKQDETAIVAAVADSTPLLREALGAPGAAGAVARLDAHLALIKAASRTPLSEAAEDYVSGAREIARRRADATRLAPPAAAARQALLAHLAAGGQRNDAWFRHAGELKKRVENAHYELGVALKTLDGLLDGMVESRKRLGPLVGEKLLVSAEELGAARKQAQDELKRAGDELERARQIPLG